MEFFIPMVPPTITHQEKKVNVVNGELGESAEFTNVIFQRTEMRRILNII